jgi:solute carrier family 25 citrate transporter 1
LLWNRIFLDFETRMVEKKDSLLINTFSSATAGLIGRFACHPVDTIKAKVQVTETRSIRQIVQGTWKQEGFSGFYKGLGAVLLGGVPGVVVYITTYDTCKAKLLESKTGHDNPFLVYLSSGMIAEAIW